MEDLKQAMRDGDEQRRLVLRLARSAIKNAEIAQGRQLDDEGVLIVLAKEAKQRRESIDEYRKAHRDDLVNAEQGELDILLSYLPRQLSPEELRDLVRQTIGEVGATSPKDIGKVMSIVMAKVKGRADGRVVNPLVREELESCAAQM